MKERKMRVKMGKNGGDKKGEKREERWLGGGQ